MMKQFLHTTIGLVLTLLIGTAPFHCSDALCSELERGEVTEIPFPNAELPPTLHSMWTGVERSPAISVRLPDDYDRTRQYPLLLYVPGFHGHPAGNISVARDIAGDQGWVVASVPLFKSSLDRTEIEGGILLCHADYPELSRAYSVMLGKVFEQVPNIDKQRSAMVGFSNGAIAIAVLVSSHDPFVLDHFRNFCLVDNGMFHLTDLHKSGSRACRFLLLSGDQEGPGRELKLRQGQLLQDAWSSLGVDLTFQVMANTGHEFAHRHRQIVRKWLEQGTSPSRVGD